MRAAVTLLGVFCLSGCLTSSTCLVHKYHFVNDKVTWYEAQTYCRNKYTDLATIENTAEMHNLISTVSSAGYNSEVWIGLFIQLFATWTTNLTTDYLAPKTLPGQDGISQNCWCRSMSRNGYNWYENCSMEHPFICDNGTQQIFVNITVDFVKAWSFCRESFTDMTTEYSSSYTSWYSNVQALVPSGDRAWIGVIASDYFFWSDASSSLFKYWDELPPTRDSSGVMHGFADLQRSGKWSFVPAGTLPFVCYTKDIHVEMTTKKVLKLRMSSSVIDCAVKADILTQLQSRFTEKGASGATAKWRTPPEHEDKTHVIQEEC